LGDENKEASSYETAEGGSSSESVLEKENAVESRSYISGGQTASQSVEMRGVKIDSTCLPCPSSPPLPAAGAASRIGLRRLKGKRPSAWERLETLFF
jgi:hypothetical protein